MKLLSPQAVRDVRGTELARDMLRVEETKAVVNKTNADLARSQADFSTMLAGQRDKWAREEKEHGERALLMEKEIKELEAKKAILNIPIEIEQEKAHTLFKEAQTFLENAKQKEQHIDSVSEILEDRLDEVAQREIECKAEERRLETLKKGMEEQLVLTSEGSKKLTDEMLNFVEQKAKDEASIYERKKEITLIEISLEAKQDKGKRDMEALRVFEIQLNDRSATLDRAFKRLENNKQ